MTTCGCPNPSLYFSRDFGSRICQNCGTIITSKDSEESMSDIVTPFIHLRVHTHLSFLKSTCKYEDIIELTKQEGMSAVAKTEFGNMCGVPMFVKKCVKENIKPIIGVEFKVVFPATPNDITANITFIALNNAGYRSLVKLTTQAWCARKNKQYGVHILWDDIPIAAHHFTEDSLIALFDTSSVPSALMMNHLIPQIKSRLETFLDINMDTQGMNDTVESVAQNHNLQVVATGNVLYTKSEDRESYGVALKIGKHQLDYYVEDDVDNNFKSQAEMTFAYNPIWIENSFKIAERVQDYGIINKDFIIPTFKDANGEWSFEESCAKLEMDSWVNLANRGFAGNKIYEDRLKYELDTMKNKKFSGYFLLINEIVEYMKKTGKLKPIGRGSSVGSLVCFLLDITSMDPIIWNVPFERFINQGRIDLPDVDTDITQEGRGDVLHHIADVHGHNKVAQIATYQTMGMRAVIDNVGRALQAPHILNRELRKDIPEDLEDVNKLSAEVKEQMHNFNPKWIDAAESLFGTAKNLGYHAAGVVIANEDLSELAPLMPPESKDGLYGIQYDMYDCEVLGLLKLDMLGLKNLDIIQHTVERIKQNHGIDVDVYSIPPDDQSTYDLVSSGEYVSVFQLDSTGYRRLCKQLQPQGFEHLMALTALYRPGPLESGVTAQYINRRHGKEASVSWHPWLDQVLDDTYQTVLYQEQAMAMSRIIAGFTDVEADKFRKGIGKKIPEIVDACLVDFKKGGMQMEGLIPPPGYQGSLENWLDELTEKLHGYARYMWNRGHSAGYGWITYITAHLEAHYPHEYYISLLDANEKKAKKLAVLIRSILSKNIDIVPPSVNESSIKYAVGSDYKIYMGLAAIRNVGKAAAEIAEERNKNGLYTSFIEFCQRLPKVNKTAKVNLVKAGSFSWDKMMSDRNKVDNIDIINKFARKRNKKYDGSKVAPIQIAIECHIDGSKYSEIEAQENERAVLNSFITGHPAAVYHRLANYFDTAGARVICPSGAYLQTEDKPEGVSVGNSVLMIGMIDSIKHKRTRSKIVKRGGKDKEVGDKPYLNLLVSDDTGFVSVNIWYPLSEDLAKILVQGQIAMIECTIQKDKFREDIASFRVRNAIMLNHGVPIQGVFCNGGSPKDVLSIIGGIESNTINVGIRQFTSVRGRINVKPHILEEAISKFNDIAFLISMESQSG